LEKEKANALEMAEKKNEERKEKKNEIILFYFYINFSNS